MSTLAEVRAAVPHFSVEELAELEHIIRKARREKLKGTGRSALDLLPLDLGKLKRPFGTLARTG